MATSKWLAKYDSQKEFAKLTPIRQHHFLSAVDNFIHKFSDWKQLPKSVADQFYASMEREACCKGAGSIGETAARMWTSGLQLEIGPDVGMEFCSIINEAMRLDLADMMAEVALINCAMNYILVDRSASNLGPAASFPIDATSHRGGGFNIAHKDFFSEKKKFRVPHPLATSGDVNIAYDFWRKGTPANSRLRFYLVYLSAIIDSLNIIPRVQPS